jgi:hypothetical protein
MKKVLLLTLSITFFAAAKAQSAANDTIPLGVVTVNKDPRIEILGKKMGEYNGALAYTNSRTAKGYRLMVLSTSDREQAMKLRTQLLQQYPDQGVYMSFQSPYIKLKFGNFVEKADAEKVRNELLKRKLVTGNIYLVPEVVEVKPDKNTPQDDE